MLSAVEGFEKGGFFMIKLTKLNKQPFWLNTKLIETIESVPDTKINLKDDKYILVLESEDEVVDKIIAYNKLVYTKQNSTDEKALRELIGGLTF